MRSRIASFGMIAAAAISCAGLATCDVAGLKSDMRERVYVGTAIKNGTPLMTLGAASLSFSAASGGPSPAAQSVAIGNRGGGSLSGLAATVSYESGSGWLQASLGGTTAPATLTATATSSALAVGSYAARIQLGGIAALDTPISIAVSLTVSPAPATDAESVASDKATLQISYASGDSASIVTRNLTLPTTGPSGTAISWGSDNPPIVSNAGIVVRPVSNTVVTLTATIRKGGFNDTRDFALTVLQAPAAITDAQAVATDKTALQVGYASGDSAESVTKNVTLPASGASGTNITWVSDHVAIVSDAGIVVRPVSTTTVTLTATISRGSVYDTSAIMLTVLQAQTATTDVEAVATDKAALQVGYASGDSIAGVTKNLTLPAAGASGTAITWASSRTAIVSNTGTVVRPTSTTSVTLTATVKKGGAGDTKAFTFSVLASDPAVIAADKAALLLGYSGSDSSSSVTGALTLSTTGASGSTNISWSSSPDGIVASNGAVTRPAYTTAVTLTATIAKNASSLTKDFIVYAIGSGTQYGHLFVGGGDLEAYRINADGSLATVPGSPFATGSFSGGMSVSADNKRLYSVDGGGLYAFNINLDGSLSAINGSPAPVGSGASSVTLSPSGSYAFVTNAGSGADSISVYSFSASGLPLQIPGSPFSTSPSGTPTDSVIDPEGKFLYVCDSNGAGTSDIQAWAIGADGSLAKSGAAIPTYIDNFHGTITMSPDGNFVYACHAGSGNITAYARNTTDGTLTALSSSPYAAATGTSGSESIAMALTPSGKYLYTAQAWFSGTICSHRINANGSLTALACSAGGTGIDYEGSIAIDASSKFVYLTNYEWNADSKVFLYSIDTSGVLTPVSGMAWISATSPQALATTH